jgi:hypothetical protein
LEREKDLRDSQEREARQDSPLKIEHGKYDGYGLACYKSNKLPYYYALRNCPKGVVEEERN